MEIIKYAVGGAVLLVVIGYFLGEKTAGTCTVVSHQAAEETFLINGEFDYGVVINAKIKLDGAERNVKVTGRIETSNGDISKSISIGLRNGQTRDVQLQFPEPVLGTKFAYFHTSCS